ncbi:MAG: tRNA (adenosine(37)-N6)-threonylcarbamoyltransferase complex ATPase subunit type 1 TsaE [Parcubacteria group bacterium]|nr:tRNA (adenosine(37)-N6)-threonylcarbamoyltransferase complex ATPase subunit type 1 TsaE [Parcubacteria group bacterium]
MEKGADTHTREETTHRANDFIKGLVPRENMATVVALYGDLGSGKTTFVQSAAKALGVDATIISPTFVIERVYKLKNQPFEHLIHIDCYRIDASKEIALLGWDEKIANPRNLIFVEWAERIEGILPKGTIRIYFEHAGETTRKIKILNSNF